MTPVADRIRREIRERGPVPFARFMELALYCPEGGYYAAGGERIGTRGDFFTASDVGRGFGAAFARQIVEVDRRIGPLDPFHVVEFGAGRGLLARDVLDAIRTLDPDLTSRLRYVLVDRSRAMLDEARRRVPEAAAVAPDELAGGWCGAVLAVELFDALPVHRVRRREGHLVEVFVGVDGDALVEIESDCTPGVEEYAGRYGAAVEDGSEAEFAPDAASWLDAMAGCLDRGTLFIVDYGDRADRLYGPSRPAGTLLAYSRHSTNTNYLERVGEQDLTAHVNFSALEDRARSLGLEVLALTTQDRFLIANGILDAFDPGPAGSTHDPARAKARMQAMQLIHPHAMGRRFKVLALARGCRVDLAGLRDPFA